ncbi:cyclic lactone autoinducer peptide family protein [[Clostridium] bifermentans ATCC 638]|uniref:Cyclic lactone autoinducer peptide family protein n=1 Tax=Paraclostridium bifermentans ATCC 638 = DSM 14991 TaxID=1233171 RepID=T4VT46_PARBF|nr:cyclic lactone autoinducer peptide [Paraclostridium bifermentans]EQK43877.1 cyclic lactone autoinducer peptide family protein [[Clostridium] bifermentans ATCC 638] [Paraclostridium bifermentans ATCC 638 = DSM 14991]RIZ59431.1 cyclic lactone autoinducer peptide [Paraclostridium bifermentans]UAG17701.1 cyclic lactone autoinducer peptide [Paraclostridium bifermentans]
MNFLANLFSDFAMNLGNSASTMCTFVFFEPEMPKSLREE